MSGENLLNREDAALLVVDMQERILPVINDHAEILKKVVTLVKGAKIINIPIKVTEQYPKGLGHSVSEVRNECAEAPVFEKMSFSCTGSDEFMDSLEDSGCGQVIICGIETHVCVLQTALELLNEGIQVFVAADAVGSRDVRNYQNAIRRMEMSGAVISNTESILFELLASAAAPEFKEISRLVK